MVQMQSMVKTKLSYNVRSDQVRSVTKTRHDNNVTNCTSAVYVENNTKVSWLIESGVIYDKKLDRTTTWLII